MNTKERLLCYYRSERDLRGYVDGKGWAHGAAHGADALDELALCRECDASTHRELLDAIKFLICNRTYILCHKEDDRVINVVYSIYSMKLISNEEIGAWMEALEPAEGMAYDYKLYTYRVNARNLLRSIFFRLRREGCDERILDRLCELERKLQ